MNRRGVERTAWLLGAIGLAASVMAWIIAPIPFAYAWLAALTCFLAWPLGSLALLFIHALTGGRWGAAVRPQLDAGIATLPLLIPALIPLPFVAPLLYPWMHAEVAVHLTNRFYLNAPFFYARAVVYLLVWLALAFGARRALRRPDPEAALSRLAPLALILLTLTVTFAAIDSTLSLTPQFKSSIYGLLACVEAVLFALSIAIFALALTGPRSTSDGGASPNRVLGRLLLALVVLWAYLDFMQFLIVWNSNLPDEAGWYVQRLSGGWEPLALAVVLFHFALPLFTLLWPAVQRSARMTASVAAVLIVLEVPRAWWIVIPASNLSIGWSDAATMLALLALATGLCLRSLRAQSLRVDAHG